MNHGIGDTLFNPSFFVTLLSIPPIAQLVEQSPLKRKVVGSNPTGRTSLDCKFC